MVPGDSLVPIERNQSAPRARMCGMFDSVSTLLTSVGLGPLPSGGVARGVDSQPSCGPDAKRPSSWGANQRGRGDLPSITSSIAFSSPKRYSSGPAMMLTVQSVQMPAAWNSWTARVTASISRLKLALRQM